MYSLQKYRRERCDTWPSRKFKEWLDTSNLPHHKSNFSYTTGQLKMPLYFQIRSSPKHYPSPEIESRKFPAVNSRQGHVQAIVPSMTRNTSKKLNMTLSQGSDVYNQLALKTAVRHPNRYARKQHNYTAPKTMSSTLKQYYATSDAVHKQVKWNDGFAVRKDTLRQVLQSRKHRHVDSTEYLHYAKEENRVSDITPPPSPPNLDPLLTLRVYRL